MAEEGDDDDFRWTMEFYTHKAVPNTSILRARSIGVSPDEVNYFRKILLLRVLQECVRRDSIQEHLLEIMELLDGLLPSRSAAFNAAFCAVAVDCTVKHLRGRGSVSSSSYLDAVKRLSWKRVRPLKPSLLCPSPQKSNLWFSEELERWRRVMVASVTDLSVREWLAAQNTKMVAMDKIKAFLRQNWESLNLSFLLRLVHAAQHDQCPETQYGKCTTSANEKINPPTPSPSDVRPTTTSAHAHEGETSNHTHLKRKGDSPLKNHEPPNTIKLRKKRKWSSLETETLLKAVNEFGPQWKKILNAHKDVFERRTNVNLKDKWRNIDK